MPLKTIHFYLIYLVHVLDENEWKLISYYSKNKRDCKEAANEMRVVVVY